MKKAIFITVRTGSTRLPNKALLKVNNKTMIEHLITRVKESKEANSVILCTTILPEDDILCEIAQNRNILFYRGSVKDKLERWKNAAVENNIDFFVTADGDDIFCEPELIDLAFQQYSRTNADFIEGKDIICGSFTYGIKVEALKTVCSIKNTDDTEMMWVYFTETNRFKTEILQNVPKVFKRDDIRMTLDYEDDFKFFKHIIEHFKNISKNKFSLGDIVEYLDQRPEIIKINQHLHNEWKQNQINKTKLILNEEILQ